MAEWLERWTDTLATRVRNRPLRNGFCDINKKYIIIITWMQPVEENALRRKKTV